MKQQILVQQSMKLKNTKGPFTLAIFAAILLTIFILVDVNKRIQLLMCKFGNFYIKAFITVRSFTSIKRRKSLWKSLKKLQV